MPVVKVRPRSRRGAIAKRDREVQGMLLATLGSDLVGTDEVQAVFEPVETPRAAAKRARRTVEIQPLPYRKVLATWPDHWRERWGRLANALEDRGISWRDAESRAFVEIWSEFRASADAFRH